AAIIFEGVKQAAFVHGLEMIPDEGLLAEVSGLAEWPVVYIGTIQDEFMDVPAEILQTSMRTHQKYFSLRDPKTGKMANRFALVANMIASDGGKEIVAGNERVLRARLSDAKFFWDEDRKHSLESRIEKLKGIVFHAKLGTQYQRAERIRDLAGVLAARKGLHPVDVELVRRAAMLCKADLTTGVVGEFPELQGVMGYYYALNDDREPVVAEAIRDHYKPLGPSDTLPRSPTSLLVALADKLDALVSFFSIGERPTGSGDPFALRRAALGAIRIILESEIRIELRSTLRIPTLFALIHANIAEQKLIKGSDEFDVYKEPYKASAALMKLAQQATQLGEKVRAERPLESLEISVIDSVISFLADRLKVALKEKGTRHDLIDAVFSLGHEDDLVRLVARVEALQSFLKSDDGANLLAGYKRAANILKVEEKKDGKTFISEVSETLLSEPAEKALFSALASARAAITPALEKEDFAAAMQQMAALRSPVDAFFDAVKVNADDKQMRENRLNLLASLRATLHQVADFSKIEG
ncbi:MAG TPA: glycine--tRNA ligase subunit beta, partial [Rhizomicrobium sp.]|nr:glycine--tRNA ligase subunit beta [Rhizomicrobium sp.]